MPGPWSATRIRTSGPARPAVTATTPPSRAVARAHWPRRCAARGRGGPGRPRRSSPGSTATSMRADRSRRGPSSASATSGIATPRSTRRRSRLERGRLGPGEVVDVGHDAAQRGGRRAGGLEARDVGRDDAVDHRLELRFEDGRRRREVVGDVAGRAPAEHLRALEAVGHGVERLGQLGRLAVVAARRPRARLARLEPPRGGRHVVQRAGQPAGDRGRHEHDPEHAHQAGDRERDVEQRQEARGRRRGPARRPRASRRACRRPRSAIS